MGLGRAAQGNSMILVTPLPVGTQTPAMQVFGAFNATIDLDVRSNEFGLGVGDWSGGMVVEFRNRADNSLVATHTWSGFWPPLP